MFSCFHLVGLSVWPVVFSFSVGTFLLSVVYWLNVCLVDVFYIYSLGYVVILVVWLLNVIYEFSLGCGVSAVVVGLCLGVGLFIVSEVMFFFGFFWSFFHKSVSPSYSDVGGWPFTVCKSLGLVLDPFSIPMLKTILLLSSGFSITLGHYGLMCGEYYKFLLGVFVTLFWGLLFMLFQFDEYLMSGVSVNSYVFGSVFFMLTGFHGMHVFVGLCFMIFSLMRTNYHLVSTSWSLKNDSVLNIYYKNSPFHYFMVFVSLCFSKVSRLSSETNFAVKSHLGFEVAVWYWHFVDVVWIFLFFFLYVMGS